MKEICDDVELDPQRTNREGTRSTIQVGTTGLASGILFVAVQIATLAFTAAFLATTHPPMNASPQEAARDFAQAQAMVEIGTFLYVLQVPFLLVFLGGLFGVLRRAEGGSGALSVSVLGAGIAMVVIASMGALISSLTPIIGQLGGDGATVKAIDAMTPLALALSAFPRAVLLGVTSIVILESGIAARWMGWAGLALNPCSVVGATDREVVAESTRLAEQRRGRADTPSSLRS